MLGIGGRASVSADEKFFAMSKGIDHHDDCRSYLQLTGSQVGIANEKRSENFLAILRTAHFHYRAPSKS